MDEPLTFNKKKQKEAGKYSIVTFDLHKPKGNKYPQFDFAQVKKKLGCGDSDDDDDERFHDSDAREIVRRLEAKYPNKKSKSGRKIRYNEDDFIEKSLGYDMDDEFIDDSEAHDELVPSTLDTKKGGFYVNKGPLEFVSIGEEGSEEESDDEEERPKNKKKAEEKATVRAPKRPDQVKADEAKKADEVKKTADESKKPLDSNPKKRVAISSSSSDEESEREEARRVGGPPTLKRSKPSIPVVSSAASSPALVKKTDEKASEPRRMTGAPPNLARKKTEPVSRPSLAGRPPINYSPVKAAAEIPIETISSEEDEDSRQPEPSNGNRAGPGASDQMEVDINEVPHPVQLKIVAFEALCQKHHKQGRKHLADVVADGAREIQELMNRLGLKKGLKGVVMEKIALMCGYTRAGIELRIKRGSAPASAPAPPPDASTGSTSTASASSAPIPPSLPAQQQQQKAAPSSSNESMSTVTSSISSTSSVEVVPGPSKPNPAVVIGVKPPTASPAAAAVPRAGEAKKVPERMIGKWTASQVQEALKLLPDGRKMLEECAMQMKYEDFCKLTTNPKAQSVLIAAAAAAPTTSAAPTTPAAATAAPAATTAASSTSRLEEARKAWREQLKRVDPANWDNVSKIMVTQDFLNKFVVYKQSMMKKHPLLGEKAMLHMDATDNVELVQYFAVFIELGKKAFINHPIIYLAYLDDMMKHFCGPYARTDRLIRHFLKEGKYKEYLDRIRLLPEFIKMGQQFAEKESMLSKMSHPTPTVTASASNGKSAVLPSGSKSVLKQPQVTPPSMSQQLQQVQQLQQQLQKFPHLAQIKPHQLQALLTSLPGTSSQDPAVQNLLVMQLLQQHVTQVTQEEKAKKAKEEEERRISIAKAKADEAEKRRKEKEEAAALKKAQKEEEKRLEKERKQKEADEEKKRKEEEKNKRIEEERQRRIREEEEKERRRKEEIERKLREEAEKKKLEEEMARKREELRIKQEEEKREREKKEMEERLREEEERAALMLADEVTMEMEELEGVPRPLTEIEEVEVAEEEERKRERERQVIAAREAAMQRQNSMAMSAGLGAVKQENPDKELLDSFFMEGGSNSQSSTMAIVDGPVTSREKSEITQPPVQQPPLQQPPLQQPPVQQPPLQQPPLQQPPLQQPPLQQPPVQQPATASASASSSNSALHSFSELKGFQEPMSIQSMMMQSPHIHASRFQNGSHYINPSNPSTPAAYVGSPFPSHPSPHHASPMAAAHSSPMMNPSPSQMSAVCKSELGGGESGSSTPTTQHRHNSFSSPSSLNLGSPQMQQPQQPQQMQQQQPQQQQQQHQQQSQAFFPNQQLQSTSNGMHQQQQPSMQRQNSQPSFSQQQHIPQMQQQSLQQMQQNNMGNMQWQQPMMQQQAQPPLRTPHPTPPHLQQQQQLHHPVMQQQQQHGQMQLQQQRMQLQQQQQADAAVRERERQHKLQQLQQKIELQRQTVAKEKMMMQQREMMMGDGRGMMGGGMQMGQIFPTQQQHAFQSPLMQQQHLQQQPQQPAQQPQPVMTDQMRQMALIAQQNAQMEQQRALQQQNHINSMNRYM